MAQTKFPGVPIVLNGETYLIPSLSLRQVQENYDVLSEPFEITNENLINHFNTFLPVITLAIQRNYPDVTEDNLRDWLALSSFYKVLAIVKGVSGLTEVDRGE